MFCFDKTVMTFLDVSYGLTIYLNLQLYAINSVKRNNLYPINSILLKVHILTSHPLWDVALSYLIDFN